MEQWLILPTEKKGKMLQVLLTSPFTTQDRPGPPDRPWNAPSLNRTSLSQMARSSRKVSVSLILTNPSSGMDGNGMEYLWNDDAQGFKVTRAFWLRMYEHLGDRRTPKKLRLRTDGLRVGFALRFCRGSF